MTTRFTRLFVALIVAFSAGMPRAARAIDTLKHSIPAPPVGAQSGAQLGFSVATDGGVTVVGAPFDDLQGNDSGVVKVFDSSSGALLHVLPNPTPDRDDQFGRSVAISGTRVVVGASGDNTGTSDAGSAYVYDLSSGTPRVPVATLNNPGPAAGDQFGSSVAISGTRVVVGAYFDDTGASEAGSAYVYDLSSGTPTVPVATLNNPSPAEFDLFGISVAISGTRVVVGAYFDDTGARETGSAYVYDLSSGTPTVPVATLNNPGPADSDVFGRSVAISGRRVVVRAPGDDTGASDAGSAYVYDLSSGTPRVPVATLNNPAPADSDVFGRSVAISGRRVVVGAPGDDTGASDAGSAYVYDLSGGTPTVPVATLNNPGPAANDQFGNAVAISGDRAAIGAPFDDSPQTDKGSAYIYGPANVAPVAQDQSVGTEEDTARAISLTASDANGDTLSFRVVNGPTNGTLTGTPPNVTYTPNSNYNGGDSFTFRANDGALDSNMATVSITITAVNDAPVANGQAVTTDEDTAKAITLTRSDTEGNALTYSVVTLPTNGALSGTPPDVTYTPNADYSGPDSFTFKVNDGQLDSDTATVSITINDLPEPSPAPSPSPANALNISTRLRVETGNNVMIGGFIITGTEAKKVIIRALGPSLRGSGVADAVADPVLELRGSGGELLGGNDNWREQQESEIEASTLPPRDNLEAAIVATLAPGAYTAVVTGRNETTGVGLVEVYDLNQAADSQLANISTRGLVLTESNVLIGGFILGGSSVETRVVLRALGPSLEGCGVTNPLANPTLDLRDGNGEPLLFNDNWQDDGGQAAELRALGLEPQRDLESAIVTRIVPGNYTAIVAGLGGGTGVGLIEVYNVK